MTRKQLYEKNRRELLIRHSYKMVYFDYFDFSFFKKIMTLGRNGKNKNLTYNDVIIMLDTETSKETPGTGHDIMSVFSLWQIICIFAACHKQTNENRKCL